MEGVTDVSSQEELLRLRNDGKISESEYSDLLDAMKTRPADSKASQVDADKSRSKRKMGKTASILMLLGIILPVVLFLTPGLAMWPPFFLGLALEIAAIVMGVVAWPDAFAKAAVAGSAAIIVLVVLFVLLI